MKNLPCYIFLAAIASLVLLAAVSSLGYSIPFFHVAAIIVGSSGAAGVLALFIADYGPRPSLDDGAVSVPEKKRAIEPAAPATFSRHSLILRRGRTAARPSALTSLGLHNDPATLSLR